MAKKTRDIKPDTILKNYWSDNEQFADLFNAVLFEGRQVIRPEELEEADTEESTVLEHGDYAETLKASRDSIKICRKSTGYGVQLALLGLENQEHIHYAMPMRLMGYDYGSYKKQYDSNAKRYKTSDGMDADEYLSGMKKTDKFMPVITVVIYYGEKPWDGAKSLHEMLSIPPEMARFVNDYKMLLVEARQSGLMLHNINNVDLFNLFGILLDSSISRKEAKKKAIRYSEEHQTDKSVVMAVAGAANVKIDYNEFGKGNGIMFAVFEEVAQENRMEGRMEGMIKTLKKYNESDDSILKELIAEFNISADEAQKYLDRYHRGTL